MNKPIPSIEWQITYRCNYRCSYCDTGKSQKSVDSESRSNKAADAILDFICNLGGSWLIKVIGGEPMIHPRFFEICERIVKAGHRLCLTTNCSLPFEKFQRLIDISGDKLDFLTASLHLSQVKNIDDFIEKAIEINLRKSSVTDFAVTSVLTEDNFQELKTIEERLKNDNVNFQFQILKAHSRTFSKYDPEVEKYIRHKLSNGTEKIRGQKFLGTLCYTGSLFFRIDINGDVIRCFDPQPLYYLGNIMKGTFKKFKEVKPCMSRRCTCVLPANRNMIRYGEKVNNYKIVETYLESLLKDPPLLFSRFLNRLCNKAANKFRS